MTLSPQRRGPGDPCYQLVDGAIWKTSLLPSGPVTARIATTGRTTVECEAWGDGAAEFLERLPALLGVHDDATGFGPEEPTIAAAHRRVPHLRLGRTGQVLEAHRIDHQAHAFALDNGVVIGHVFIEGETVLKP
jgi:hypothetical protein